MDVRIGYGCTAVVGYRDRVFHLVSGTREVPIHVDRYRKVGGNIRVFEFDESAAGLSASQKTQLRQTVDTLRRFVTDEKPLTLGQMWHCVLRSRREECGSPIVAALRAFCLGNAGRQRLLSKGFVAGLGNYLDSFRNAAAHTTPLDQTLARECRKKLLSEDQGLIFLITPPATK